MNRLERLLTPHGRAPRKTFLLTLVSWLLAYVLLIPVIVLTAFPVVAEVTPIVYLAGLVLLGIATYMVTIRRLHDMGNSGWLALLWFVPLISLVWWIVLLIGPGTDGPNKYGQEPTG